MSGKRYSNPPRTLSTKYTPGATFDTKRNARRAARKNIQHIRTKIQEMTKRDPALAEIVDKFVAAGTKPTVGEVMKALEERKAAAAGGEE